KTTTWTSNEGLTRAQTKVSTKPAAGNEERLTQAMLSALGTEATNTGARSAIYNTREPVQALSNMESMTVEAVFILKDFHRHMDDPVVVRRLRDVGQKFSANRRTVVLTAPSISMPPELGSLVEYLDLPLPDQQRLREIIEETFTRLSKSYSLKRTLNAAGLDSM